MAERGRNGSFEVRFAGSGGQGVVLAGVLLAEAAILSGRDAAQSQAYGPQSRGGASRADVVIADAEIGFPQAQGLDALVALTDEACERSLPDLRPDGLLLVDVAAAAAARASAEPRVRALSIAATATREGGALTANMVALGALVALTGVVDRAAVEQAVSTRFSSSRFREANLRALSAGLRLPDAKAG